VVNKQWEQAPLFVTSRQWLVVKKAGGYGNDSIKRNLQQR